MQLVPIPEPPAGGWLSRDAVGSDLMWNSSFPRDHRRPHEPGGEHGRSAAHPDPTREDGGQEIHVLR